MDHTRHRLVTKLTRERLALNRLREETKKQAAVVREVETQIRVHDAKK